MTSEDTPKPISNFANTNGILPGLGWDSDILGDDESFAEFFGGFIFPFDETDPLLLSIISQAKAQWRDLFPDHDERDRLMFIAGAITMQFWWAAQSIATRNGVRDDPDLDPNDPVYVKLDDLDVWFAITTSRLASVIHDIKDEDEEDWEDIVERLMK